VPDLELSSGISFLLDQEWLLVSLAWLFFSIFQLVLVAAVIWIANSTALLHWSVLRGTDKFRRFDALASPRGTRERRNAENDMTDLARYGSRLAPVPVSCPAQYAPPICNRNRAAVYC
jgi:hypothetical protein